MFTEQVEIIKKIYQINHKKKDEKRKITFNETFNTVIVVKILNSNETLRIPYFNF